MPKLEVDGTQTLHLLQPQSYVQLKKTRIQPQRKVGPFLKYYYVARNPSLYPVFCYLQFGMVVCRPSFSQRGGGGVM